MRETETPEARKARRAANRADQAARDAAAEQRIHDEAVAYLERLNQYRAAAKRAAK